MTDPASLIALLETGVCAVAIYPDDELTPAAYGLLEADGTYTDMPAATPYGDVMRYWSRHGCDNGNVVTRWETRGSEVWQIRFWWERDWSGK